MNVPQNSLLSVLTNSDRSRQCLKLSKPILILFSSVDIYFIGYDDNVLQHLTVW